MDIYEAKNYGVDAGALRRGCALPLYAGRISDPQRDAAVSFAYGGKADLADFVGYALRFDLFQASLAQYPEADRGECLVSCVQKKDQGGRAVETKSVAIQKNARLP